MQNRSFRTDGFTLIEVAVVITIVGVLLGSGILTLGGVIQDYYYNATRTKMERLADSISLFVAHHYYIPCPASPDASAATDGVQRSDCTAYGVGATGAIGVVPYRDIGLKREDIMDAYGHPFTYVMNPAFSQSAVRNIGTVHNVCRVEDSWINTDADLLELDLTNVDRNKYPVKAAFCCPDYTLTGRRGISLDPSVQDGFGRDLAPRRQEAGGVGPINELGSPTATPIDAVGFLLISHGRNSVGAFQMNGTTNRIDGPKAGRTNEDINQRNNGQIFIDMPESESSTNYFDDLVLWRTPSQALNVSGKEGCAMP